MEKNENRGIFKISFKKDLSSNVADRVYIGYSEHNMYDEVINVLNNKYKNYNKFAKDVRKYNKTHLFVTYQECEYIINVAALSIKARNDIMERGLFEFIYNLCDDGEILLWRIGSEYGKINTHLRELPKEMLDKVNKLTKDDVDFKLFIDGDKEIDYVYNLYKMKAEKYTDKSLYNEDFITNIIKSKEGQEFFQYMDAMENEPAPKDISHYNKLEKDASGKYLWKEYEKPAAVEHNDKVMAGVMNEMGVEDRTAQFYVDKANKTTKNYNVQIDMSIIKSGDYHCTDWELVEYKMFALKAPMSIDKEHIVVVTKDSKGDLIYENWEKDINKRPIRKNTNLEALRGIK